MTDWIAKVNNQPIRQFDFDNMVQGFAFEQHRKTVDQLAETELTALRELALEKLLARELIFQEAMARGIVADEAAIDAERQKIVANFPSEDEFYAVLERAGISPLDYHRMLRQDLTVNLFVEQHLQAQPEPTDEQITTFYTNHPEKMLRKGRLRASHILLRSKAGEETAAAEAIASLHQRCEREDFATLARAHSACPSAPGGGDLGWFRRGDMAREFADAAFALAVNEISTPVTTQFGVHLIKVTGREDDVPLSLDEARPQIIALLRQSAAGQQLQDWVAELKRRAHIELPPDQ